ncbi:MAG: hypothetical protein JXD22_11575 [Sedimentisphaerales bacterium]|nr:hypothetical protein [Sedimentisphaerales bacterium]
MTEEKTTALAVVSHENWAITDFAGGDSAGLKELIAENLGGEDFGLQDLERITIPAAGLTKWPIADAEGNDDVVDAIEGVVIAQLPGRVYFAKDMAESGGEPPDCQSSDGRIGKGDPGGVCADCPLAEFGSAKEGTARGQACKQQKHLLVIRQADCLPIMITLPPTSLKPWKKYALRLTRQRLPIHGVVTRFTLTADKNKDGIKYSFATPKLMAKLSEPAKEFFKGLKAVFANVDPLPEAPMPSEPEVDRSQDQAPVD